MQKFTGLIAASYTPCHADGSLNLEPIEAMASLFGQLGLAGVFICGSTGESHSFTVAERKAVAEHWMEVAGKLPVIVHAGHNCQRDAIELAAHARAIGAAAVSALAPGYFRPSTVEDLVAFFEPIAAAAGKLPFYFYDIPSMTGVSFPTDRFLEIARGRIGNLAGIKFTSSDLMRLQGCLHVADGQFDVLFGSDEQLLAAMALGVRGAVGSTYNYAAPIYQRMLEAIERGDITAARAAQYESVKLVEVLLQHGVLRTGKAIMSLVGIDCGPVRPPLHPMEHDELKAIRAELAPLDIFARPLAQV